MSNLVTDLESPLKRVSAKVEVAILRSEFLSSIALILDCERRCIGLVEDLDLSDAYLDVTCRHLRILALTLDNLTGYLKYPFASKACRHILKFLCSMSIDNKLSDTITVSQINESHTAQLS